MSIALGEGEPIGDLAAAQTVACESPEEFLILSGIEFNLSFGNTCGNITITRS